MFGMVYLQAGANLERFVVITTVLDHAADDPACVPATCRIGLLGLGTIGAAFARLTRDAGPHLSTRGIMPVASIALVRSASRPRDAADDVAAGVTDSADVFFTEPLDVVVEVLGGVEPAYTLVRRALDRGIPVVTANKSLIAAHGEELVTLARRRGTSVRFEAGCISGVPFLGTFERRPLASRASAVTGILNGTSNSILTAMTSGVRFDAALADAQRLGFAEPDPGMDISGRDAAEKLSILARLFGRVLLDPGTVPMEAISAIEPEDISAATAFDGAIRPLAHAAWAGATVRAFVGPARVTGVTNGVVIESAGGTQCYTGPGAGPAVTAATLMDDVIELLSERRARTLTPEPAKAATDVRRPDTSWFLRLTGDARRSDVADLLGSYGVWCTRVARRGDRTYVLTCAANTSRVAAALDAVRAAIGGTATAFPALDGDAAC
jgi:homoserine dehydrogenase